MGLKYRDGKPLQVKEISGGETGGAATDDGHAFRPFGLARTGRLTPAFRHFPVREKSLDAADGHRLILFAAATDVLAGVMTDATTDTRQGVVFTDDAEGVFEPPGRREGQVRLNVHAQRTARSAGREFALVQVQSPGRTVCRRPSQRRMPRIVQGTNLHTATASGAEIIIHINGVLNNGGAITTGDPPNILHPGMGHGRYQGMPGDLQVKRAELEVKIHGPLGKMFDPFRQLQEVNRLGNPDQGKA